MEFGADDHRVHVKDTRDSQSGSSILEDIWAASEDLVARSSHMDKTSNAASCHSRLLSARRAEVRSNGNTSARRDALGSLEGSWMESTLVPGE